MISADNQSIVTIFGGAKCTPSSEEYQQAVRLGDKLARAGFAVCSGGYLGIMEAASKGAREAGGHVLGITMNQFQAEPNGFLTERVAADHFYDRLQNLITGSVGFVALRGGMGTVTEVSLVWNKLTTKVIEPRPLVLLGACWRDVVSAWQKHLAVSDADVSHLFFANTAEEAVDIILQHAPQIA